MAEQPSSATTSPGVMDLLRDGTADLHRRAETQPFQIALVKATVTRDEYATWLGQMRLIHSRLERHLATLRTGQARLAPLLRDELMQSPRLAADLRVLGHDPDSITALPSVSRFVEYLDDLATRDPLALMGVHYVLEGSKNGNSFIARALAKAWDVNPRESAAAMSYLDPHGDQQRPLWQEFRGVMNAIEFEPAQRDAMLEAARETFAAVGDLAGELLESAEADPQA
ncbi:MAG: biliverdin-producing heme oxygenase [Candidatus Eisenbacteria bacterium]|uniref:Biliverdin-producing heme oxygenase n=1 Tax=Eiseniibacteriota bacterium TaxID=2212470 RepID=A0A849SJQ6_UNCEI|nr:biliverdin-producing heme oxygenase [Candidatus Eisenbacteria bacterium]